MAVDGEPNGVEPELRFGRDGAVGRRHGAAKEGGQLLGGRLLISFSM